MKSTVLIVDDDPAARELVAERLEGVGYILHTASDGREALDFARRLLPDVILLDVLMPEIDGYEVCRRLRRDPLLRDVPVILLTALDDRASRVRGLEAGADDFVSKPFDDAELQAHVRTIARLDRYRRLHETRRRLDWVVEHSEDGYLLLGPADRVLYANARARTLLELPDEDEGTHPGVDFLGLAAGRYRLEPEDAWAAWPDTGDVPLYLLRPSSRAAAALWIEVDQLPMPTDADERMIRLRDATQKLALGRGLWKLSSLVGYKLQTPLTFVVGGLDMLTRDWEEYSDPERRRLAEIAQRSGERLRHNTEGILRFLDRSDSAEQESLGLDQLRALTGELAQALDVETAWHGVESETEGGHLPLSPVACELVLREILSNLERYHPEGMQRFEVHAALADESRPPRRQLRLELHLPGASASADEVTRAWVPYYQHTRENDPRRGLGFSMVGALIWGIGGSFGVRSGDPSSLPEDGPGLVVDILLPRLPALGTWEE